VIELGADRPVARPHSLPRQAMDEARQVAIARVAMPLAAGNGQRL
jgi:hypothetical protein